MKPSKYDLRPITVREFLNTLEGAVKAGQIKSTARVYISSDEEGNSITAVPKDSRLWLGLSADGVLLFPSDSGEKLE